MGTLICWWGQTLNWVASCSAWRRLSQALYWQVNFCWFRPLLSLYFHPVDRFYTWITTMGAKIGMKHAFWCIIWILSSLSWIFFLSQDCTSTSSTIHRPRTFLLSDQDTQDYNPPNILTETTHRCISESVKCFSSMEDDQVLFNSSQASMIPSIHVSDLQVLSIYCLIFTWTL